MSLLEQQLKELQTRKEKIGYLREAISALEMLKVPKEGDEPAIEARKQTVEDVTNFVNSLISSLEDGKAPVKTQTQEVAAGGQFSEEEVQILKDLVVRAQNRNPAPPPPQQRNRTVPQNSGAFQSDEDAEASVDLTKNRPQPPAKKGQDILQFAMSHRHLDGKRVTVTTKNGKVGGVVRGMLMPNIIVQTDTGHEAHIPPEQITVE